MNRVFLSIAAMAALMITSCNNQEDLYDSEAINNQNVKEELKNAESALGTKIDANQEWILTDKHTFKIEKLPSDIKTENIAIFDANPLSDNTAAILAYSKVTNSISLETPKGLNPLYAACIDAQGDVRVAEFNPQDEVINFTQASPYEITSANQSRGWKSFRAQRLQSASELEWHPTTNTQHFAASGWADEWAYVERGEQNAHFTNLNTYIDIVHGFLPENALNFRDSLNNAEIVRNNYFAVVGEGGGEVSVTPFYRETSQQYTRFGYYYYVPGEDRNLKTTRKYVFKAPIEFNYFKVSSIEDEKTLPIYRLIYYNENGEPSYEFPEGTQIGFFNIAPKAEGLNGDLMWYNVTESNYDLSDYLANRNVLPTWAKSYNVDWRNYSHCVMFERGGYKFIGFEDWVQDFDMNDIVLLLDGNVEDLPVAPTGSCKENIKYYRYSYGFEDTRNGDYDMNDVVLRVWRPQLNSNYLNVELAAVGAADEVYVYYTNQDNEVIPLFDGKEVHQLFRELGYNFTFYNTEGINAPKLPTTKVDVIDFSTFNYSRADFFIVNKSKNLTMHMPAAIGEKGVAPFGICMPQKEWKWPKERICITNAYPDFKAFASDQNVNTDWWKYPVEDKVLTIPAN